jgi:hypothetical protein
MSSGKRKQSKKTRILKEEKRSHEDEDQQKPSKARKEKKADSCFPAPNKRNLRKAFYAQRDKAAYWKKIAKRRHKKSKKEKKELKMERARNKLNQPVG